MASTVVTRGLPPTLCHALSAARCERGLTQETFGALLGVTARQVQHWESGARLPGAAAARALAATLELDADVQLLLFAATSRRRFR